MFGVEEVTVVNFDFIIIVIFLAFGFLGYILGGQRQLIIFINVVLPFIIIDAFGGHFTNFIYRSDIYQKLVVELLVSKLGISQIQVISMGLAYILTYILIFSFIMSLSNILSSNDVSEKIKVYFGKANSALGLCFSFVNFYVLIFWILMPMIALGMISDSTIIANALLDNPPGFSTFGQATSKSVGIKSNMDLVTEFTTLFTGEGSELYYEMIFKYQTEVYEAEDDFINDTYLLLHKNSQDVLKYGVVQDIPPYCLSSESIGHADCYTYWDQNAQNNYGGDRTVPAFESNQVLSVILDDTLYNNLLEIEESQYNSSGIEKIKKLRQVATTYEGFILWYDTDPDLQDFATPSATIDISDLNTVIQSFKNNFDSDSNGTNGNASVNIINNIHDETAVQQMKLIDKGIQIYDMIYSWKLNCLDVYYEVYDQDELPTCSTIDIDKDDDTGTKYDFETFQEEMFELILNGEKLDYMIYQYNIDYVSGQFDPFISDSESLTTAFEAIYNFSLEYIEFYSPIASTITSEYPLELLVGPSMRIGVAVFRYSFDLVELTNDIPIFAAALNDIGQICFETNNALLDPSPSKDVCSDGPMAWLAEIFVKAYFMVDDNGDLRKISSDDVQEFLDFIEVIIDNNILTQDFIVRMAEQMVFQPYAASFDENPVYLTLIESLLKKDEDGFAHMDMNALEVLMSTQAEDLFGSHFIAKIQSIAI